MSKTAEEATVVFRQMLQKFYLPTPANASYEEIAEYWFNAGVEQGVAHGKAREREATLADFAARYDAPYDAPYGEHKSCPCPACTVLREMEQCIRQRGEQGDG